MYTKWRSQSNLIYVSDVSDLKNNSSSFYAISARLGIPVTELILTLINDYKAVVYYYKKQDFFLFYWKSENEDYAEKFRRRLNKC